jgi:hypothetical protein
MDESNHGTASQLSIPSVADQATQQPQADEWTIETIIAELDREHDGTLPESAIRAAQRRRDEIIPHLIKLVERATALARDGEFPSGDGQLIALYLLTEFQASEALPVILDAMSLPSDDLHELYGDAITEDLCRIFALFASPEQIDDLITNQSLDQYVRWQAAETFSLWVRDGRMTREQAVEKLRQHMRGAIANKDAKLAGPLVCELYPFVPHEAFEEIIEAYENGLVDEFLIDFSEIEETIAKGVAHWQEEMTNCPLTGVQDTVDEFRDWYCFQGEANDYDDAAYDDGEYNDEDTDVAQAFRAMMPRPPLLLGEPSLLDDPLLDKHDFLEPHGDSRSQANADSGPIRRTAARVGRNEPCPCGSGKKFKKCCGKQ